MVAVRAEKALRLLAQQAPTTWVVAVEGADQKRAVGAVGMASSICATSRVLVLAQPVAINTPLGRTRFMSSRRMAHST